MRSKTAQRATAQNNVPEDSDRTVRLFGVGDAVETDQGPGTLVAVDFHAGKYHDGWVLDPPSLVVELEDGTTIHTCLCSITLPGTVKGTKLIHKEFDRLWPAQDDEVPEDSNMLIPEGDEPVREDHNERNATMKNRRYASLRLEDLELDGWWTSETREFQKFVLRLLATLPGGDEAENMGFEPFGRFMGWQEMKMVTEMLDKIEYKDDVAQLINDLVRGDDEY